jgi:hypothetical protein
MKEAVALFVDDDGAVERPLRVSLRRHPCDWLASVYVSFKEGRGNAFVLDKFRGPINTFDDFVSIYLYQIPGEVGRVFDRYKADTCLRVEDFPWAFTSLMETVGVPAELRRRCWTLSMHKPPLPSWPDKLRSRFKESERRVFDDYEYS